MNFQYIQGSEKINSNKYNQKYNQPQQDDMYNQKMNYHNMNYPQNYNNQKPKNNLIDSDFNYQQNFSPPGISELNRLYPQKNNFIIIIK